MIPSPAPSSPLRPPRIELRPDGQAVVTRWGQVDGLTLRPGDRLLPGPAQGDRVLLQPRGLGRPMLAERRAGRLYALPGRVPVGEERWTVVMGVIGIERDLERGGPGLDGLIGLRGSGAERPAVLSAAEVEGLCLRLLIEARTGPGIPLALGVDAAQARELLEGARGAVLRFPLDRPSRGQGQLIAGPWPAARTSPPQMLLPLATDTRRSA